MARVLEAQSEKRSGARPQADRAWPFLCLIVLGSVLVQFPFRERPLFGHFSSYQVLMGMMAKFMVWENFSHLLYPKLFYVLDGSPSLHLVNYPIASLLAALGHRLLGGSIDLWGRLQAVLSTQAATLLLYAAVRRLAGAPTSGLSTSGDLAADPLSAGSPAAGAPTSGLSTSGDLAADPRSAGSPAAGPRRALLAAAVYAASPLVLIYGQSFQNEAVAGLLLVASFFLLTLEANAWTVASAGLALSLAVVSRHHFLFALPGLLAFLWTRSRVLSQRVRWMALFTTMAVAVPALWLGFVYHLAQTRTDVYTHPFIQYAIGKTFPHPLLGSPEFYKRLLDDAVNLYFNPIGFTFLAASVVWVANRDLAFARLWVGSVAALFVLAPVKIFDHSFYAFPLLPAGAMLIAAAAEGLLWGPGAREGEPVRKRWLSAALAAAVFCAFSLVRVIGPIYKHDPSERSVLKAAEFLKAQTTSRDLVVDGYRGVMLTLYYADRLGWPCSLKSRREISPYWSSPGLQNLSEEAWQERNAAFETPSGWLEYLRKQGADIFMASDRRELEALPEFLEYLKKRYRELSSPQDTFMAFDVRRPR